MHSLPFAAVVPYSSTDLASRPCALPSERSTSQRLGMRNDRLRLRGGGHFVYPYVI